MIPRPHRHWRNSAPDNQFIAALVGKQRSRLPVPSRIEFAKVSRQQLLLRSTQRRRRLRFEFDCRVVFGRVDVRRTAVSNKSPTGKVWMDILGASDINVDTATIRLVVHAKSREQLIGVGRDTRRGLCAQEVLCLSQSVPEFGVGRIDRIVRHFFFDSLND
jgi:hypothetical protein